MIQILFGLGSDIDVAGAVKDAFRDMFVTLDKVVYSLIGWVYNILFEIADTSILKSSVLKDFYLRVQLILGVVMVFKVSVSLLQYVINPDAFNDKKNGFGQVITRIIMILVMLSAIIPLNIPSDRVKENSYNDYLNQYGLLFGTLYSLQHRILSNNTIFKLVLGNSTGTLENDEAASDDGSFAENSTIGSRVATYMLKGFISINVHKNEEGLPDVSDLDKEDYMCSPDSKVQDNDFIKNTVKYSITYSWTNLIVPGLSSVVGVVASVFEDDPEDSMGYYYNIWWKATTPEEITQLVNVSCNEKNYGFSYLPIISTICGAILLVLIGAYCIDVAVRTLKLAVLQLIAPIAIISYIDPKSNEKGTFASWTKLLISTYLDLFLRLAIFAFISFLCLEITNGGLNIQLTGVYRFFANIFLMLGLFFFARIAPKFISDALGIKGMMSNVGLSGILAAAGTVRAGGNLRDVASAVGNSTRMQADAFNQGKHAPGLGQTFNSGSDLVAQRLTGNDKMSYAQMMRNRRQNTRAGITPQIADEIHAKKFDLDDKAVKAQNLYDNFLKGNLTANEINGLNSQFGHLNDQTGQMEMNDAEYQRAREYLENNALHAKSEAGKWSAYDDEVQKKIASSGQKQSFEEKYRARTNQSNARLSDLTSSEGRNAMLSEGFVQGVRNVTSIPRNEMRTARENITGQINQRTTNRVERQQRSNENINQSR